MGAGIAAEPAEPSTTDSTNAQPMDGKLLERVLERDNLQRALKQVRRNKGAPGIDGMSVDELPKHLVHHWEAIKADILAGRYRPQPVRRVEIPKPDGRKRMLGIPTVLDRFVQQAIAQIVQTQWEPHFHPDSYGFRPQRSAHQAVRKLQADVKDGHGWVVDLDLESFFDRVNHDRLLHRLRQHVDDRALLRLITAFLKAGAWVDGQRELGVMGVPQGGPLSPVLANVVLDEMDWELSRRGHRFARYADDCNIAVKSERAGQRVMHSVTRWIEDSLRLTVNSRKSAVDRPWNRKFLGFTLSRRDKNLKVADTAIDKLKDRVRELSRRTRGQSLSQIVAELRETLLGWKWGSRGYRELRKRGVSVREAWNVSKSAHGPWRISQTPALSVAMPTSFLSAMGLPELAPAKA
ncbi:MAG: group II intron reverse transcriptase/maturase [Burkholderiales bacterium]|nr:group II intron reverse transcriptase/maturase [Burkholderiales bacterium]